MAITPDKWSLLVELDEEKEVIEVASKIQDKLWELGLDVPFGISSAEPS